MHDIDAGSKAVLHRRNEYELKQYLTLKPCNKLIRISVQSEPILFAEWMAAGRTLIAHKIRTTTIMGATLPNGRE